MKKLLKMSLVAALAVSPLMANAADVNPYAYRIDAQNSGQASTNETDTPRAADGKYFKGKTVSDADKGIVATGAYVKGAYNAAISAINAVADDLTTNLTVSGGDGVAVTTGQDGGQVVSVDYADNGALGIDANNKLKTNVDSDTIEINSDNELEVKRGAGMTVDANGVAVNVETQKGLQIDNVNNKLEIVNGNGIGFNATSGAVEVKYDNSTIRLNGNGQLEAQLGDYATKAGVVNTIESSSVQTVTGVSMTGGQGVTAYTDWTDETSTGQTTLGASSITVTTGRANVEITRAAGSENTVENKYKPTAATTPAASGTTPSNATSSTTYPQGA